MKKNLRVPGLFILALTTGLPRISDTASLPALPQISLDFGITASIAELSLTVNLLAVCLMIPFWGFLIDTLGRRKCFLLGNVAFGLGSLLCLISCRYEIFFLGRFIQGMGGSCASVLVQTIVRDTIPSDKRGRAYSFLGALIPIAPAIGPLLGGIINQFFHWRAIFLVTGLANAVFGLYGYLYLMETRPSPYKKSELKYTTILKLLRKDREFLGFSFAMGSVLSIITVYSAEGSFFFIKLFKVSPGEYGLLAAFISGMLGVGGIASAYFHKRGYKAMKLMRMGMQSLFSVTSFYVILTGLQLTHPHGGGFALFLNIALLGATCFSAGIIGPNAVSAVSEKHPEFAGTVSALFSLIYFMSGMLFSIFMSMAHNGTVYALPIVLFIIAASSAGNFFFLLRKK